jgi:PAS domain S-box-containing protein
MPLAVMTAGVALTVAFLALVGWDAWNVFDRFRSIVDLEVKFQVLSGDIVYLDEALTMSARMAALTSDPRWKARYQRLEPRLRAVILETMELTRATDARNHAANIDEANRMLVDMESRAFALLEQGRRRAATALLFSDEYEAQERKYTEATRLTVEAIRAQIRTQSMEVQGQLVVAVVVWLICLAILVLAWITILALMRRYHKDRDRTEAELSAARRQNFLILNSVDEGIHGVDIEGRILFTNRAAATLLGYDEPELIGKPVHALIHHHRADGREYPWEECAVFRTLCDGEVRQLEGEVFFRKDGTSFPIEFACSPIREESGAITGAVVCFRDITARKQAEGALRASEARLRTVVESEPECVKVVSVDGRLLDMNPAGLRMIEAADLGSLLGRPVVHLVHPEDRGAFLDLHRRVCRGETGRLQFRLIGLKGTERWMETHSTPLRDGDGSVTSVLSITRDVTERKQAEERLRESEERFHLLAKATNDAIWDWNLETNELWWNEGFEALFGYRRDEVEPTIESWTTRIHPDDYDRIVPDIHRVIDGGGDHWSGEYRFRRKDGAYAYVLDRGHVIRDPSGKAVRMVGGMTDLTERKNLEAQLLHSQKMEAIGRLAGGIAHDFNNLLTVINGYCELLLEESRDASRNHVEQIALAAERAATLTSRLLAFSRRQVVQFTVVDLNAVLENTRNLLIRLIGEPVELVMILDPALGRVKADPGQIEQVIMNLAVNARDAMPQGGTLRIRTANVTLDRPDVHARFTVPAGSYVMLEVVDTGIGMNEDTQAQIFEPFFTTKAQGEGTGLGLSTVYGIVKQSDGYILVDSQPGRGATFTILLPRAMEEAATTAVLPSENRPLTGRETVLLVEDEDMIRDLVRHLLESHGYTVIAASKGEEAVDLAERHVGSIDLLVTDVVMPGMSGRELADRLGRSRANLRVLYMSGYTYNEIGRHGVLASDIAFIQKPFSPDGLMRKVREVLDATHAA